MAKSRHVSEMPQKPLMAMPNNPPPYKPRHVEVLAYINTKNDAGDLAAAMMYQPTASRDRLATRMASVEGDIDKALSRFK